ncbi:hypothetical protein GCM10011391_23110 [Pullulanibacillus camelliae]|uniref:B3/B4 tRNA-binding domain-containing protein n=1 Tax=Pullulanibacillus camelliae TaxID=1707096 RepID=A0A8J2YHU9_9BACL|nr:phenylalanine--tRNA ligase beta subunit-related protein [Pullulanibacillus camelliae]GGE43701.1 hypothetical protein GCM10011391_23110 [Pullulanibacillus camelliae]
MTGTLSKTLTQTIPHFKTGWIHYHDIVVSDSQQLLKGRLTYFSEELMLELEEKSISDLPRVKEWRQIFKQLGTDPSRYRPSHEALLRRIRQGKALPHIHTAADLNNYFSVRHQLPMGIYDLDKINGSITIRVGTASDHYEGLNGRDMSMEEKLVSADALGAFGSPIVDSKRTMTTTDTTAAIQLIYFTPSMNRDECETLLKDMADFFLQINGGEANWLLTE